MTEKIDSDQLPREDPGAGPGVFAYVKPKRFIGQAPGLVQVAPVQTRTVQTPYRPMSSPANYVHDVLWQGRSADSTQGRVDDIYRAAGIAQASDQSRFVSQADRRERDVANATRAAKADMLAEMRNPISLADMVQRDADSAVSRLTPDEASAFSAQGIERQNAADAQAWDAAQQAAAPYKGTGRPWVSDHLQKLSDQKLATQNDRPAADLSVVGPAATTEDRLSWLARTNSDLFAAVSLELSSGRMSPLDVAKVTNMSLAVRAAQEIAATPDPIRRTQLLEAQGTPAQQALVLAVLTQPKPDDVSSDNLLIQAASPLGDWLVNTALPFLGTTSQYVIRGAMAVSNVGDNKVVGWDTQKDLQSAQWDWSMWRDAWNQTAPGYFRPEDVDYLRNKYGASKANLMLEAYALRNSGEGDTVGVLYEKYAGNVEALNIIDALFFSRDPDTEMQDLVQETAYMDWGNYANWQIRGLADLFGGDLYTEAWSVPAYGWGRDALNVTAWMTLDPYLLGGKVVKVAKYARWGLHRMAPGKIENTFQRASVRRYWDDLGGRLKDIRGMESGRERRRALRTVAQQEKHWFPRDVVQSLYDAEVHDADGALAWFQDMENMKRVLAGQPARRGGQKYVPHANRLRVPVKNASFALRTSAFDPTMRVARRHGEEFDSMMERASEAAGDVLQGRRFDELNDQEAAAVISKIGTNPAGAEVLGKWMSSLTGDKTVTRKFLEAVRVGNMKGARQYGFQHEKNWDNFFQFASRAFAQVPDMGGGIRIDSAVDARKVYQQARIAGFPRWFAVEMEQMFASANVGQRRLMLAGLARTQAYVIGADLVDPQEGVDNMVKLVTSYRPGEAYAATMIPGAARKQQEIIAKIRAKSSQTLRLEDEKTAEENLQLLNDYHGQQAVNDATEHENAKLIREEARQRVVALQDERAKLEAQIDNAGGKSSKELEAEIEAEYQALLANMTGNQFHHGAADGGDLLNMFWLPDPAERKVPAITFKKTPGGGRRGVVKDGDGNDVVYTIEQDPEFGHFTVRRDGEIVGSGMNMTQARNIAKEDVAANYSIVDRTVTAGVDREYTMLQRGYLPERWAREIADGNLPGNVRSEDQARLFLDPGAPEGELLNLDFRALAESAGKPKKGDGVGGGGRWIQIPWVQSLRRQARGNVEGRLGEHLDQFDGEIDNALRELKTADDVLNVYREEGIPDMETLRAVLPRTSSMSEDEILAEARSQFETWLRTQAQVKSPSEGDGGQHAVFMGQTSNVVAFPSITQFEPLMARNTYLGTLLGRNVGSAAITDLWVFATLAGPRFSIRNAFEDWIFWGLSAGTMVGDGSLRSGRRAAQGLRQSRQIESKKLVAARQSLEDLEQKLKDEGDLLAPNERKDLEHSIGNMRKEVTKLANKHGKVRTQKLGIIKTQMRRLGTRIGKLDNSVDPLDSRLKAIVHPYLSDKEIEAANAAYADGDRTKLAQLLAKAATRERVLWLPKGNSTTERIQNWIRMRNGDVSVLSEHDQRVLSEIEQFAMGRNGFDNLNAVSEEARNMMDGMLPSWQDTPDFVYAGQTPLQRIFLNYAYKTQESGSRATQKAVNATWQTLAMALHGDGPKAQAAMFHLPTWMGGTAAEREAVLDEVVDAVLHADAEHGYIGRFSLVNAEGEVDEAAVRELARSTMLTLEGAFTTRNGTFNEALWKALRRDDAGDGNLINFKLWDDVDLADSQGVLLSPGGKKREYRVSKYDFTDGKYDLPRTYLTFEGDGLMVPADATFGAASKFGSGWAKITNPGWDAMGRSLARMTREPMYMANYLEARSVLRPFEDEWKRLYGEDWWRVADEIANEQAYNVTLSYVDNPAIRSQLAWQVRNVARFWRAQEDFFRRSYRLVKNNPMGVYKAAWAYNVLQTVGFFQKDDNGEYYFIYPTSNVGMNYANVAMSWLAGNFNTGTGLPLHMTGRLTGLTPSADPEALFPTLSGPMYPMMLKGLMAWVPSLNPIFENANLDWRPGDLANTVQATALGEISASPTATWMDALPTHLKRLFTVGMSFAGDRMAQTTGAVADAARIAITANVRAGYINTGEELTNQNRDEIMARVEDTTTDILVLKLLAGAFLPASPQIQADDVSMIAREFGMYSLKQEYYDLRQRLGDDEAVALWIERHPDEAPYTVSSAGGPEYDGFWAADVQTEEWIRGNRVLVDRYPLASSLLAPKIDEPKFNTVTYRFLQRQGLLNKGTVFEYLQKSMGVNSWLDYMSAKAEYDRGVQTVYETVPAGPGRDAALKELDQRLANFRGIAYSKDPGLEERVKASGWGMSPQAVMDEVGQALPLAIDGADESQMQRLTDLRDVYNMYLQGMSVLDQPNKLSPEYADLKDEIRDRWKGYVLAWYGQYREDENFVRVLKTASDALGFQIRELR